MGTMADKLDIYKIFKPIKSLDKFCNFNCISDQSLSF